MTLVGVGRSLRYAFVLASGLAASSPTRAEDFTLSDVWTDTTAYFTSPLHWSPRGWEMFGGTVAAVVVAHQFDDTVRNHFAGHSPPLNGQDKHSTSDAIPAAALVAGTWLVGWSIDAKTGRIEAYRMLEAAALGGVTTEVFKYAAGRSRPNETLHPNEWRQGGSSFPSLHATAAFAIGTVFAESGSDDYRWIRRAIGYGVAGYTGYARLHDNAHWLSDVVAGAAVGVYSGAFTLDRRYPFRDLSINVTPARGGGGVALQFTYTWP